MYVYHRGHSKLKSSFFLLPLWNVTQASHHLWYLKLWKFTFLVIFLSFHTLPLNQAYCAISKPLTLPWSLASSPFLSSRNYFKSTILSYLHSWPTTATFLFHFNNCFFFFLIPVLRWQTMLEEKSLNHADKLNFKFTIVSLYFFFLLVSNSTRICELHLIHERPYPKCSGLKFGSPLLIILSQTVTQNFGAKAFRNELL